MGPAHIRVVQDYGFYGSMMADGMAYCTDDAGESRPEIISICHSNVTRMLRAHGVGRCRTHIARPW
jgi:hypothetical protein